MPAKRRQFGNVRKLPSGRYQASYVGADGKRVNAPETFARKPDANAWLTNREADIIRGITQRAKAGNKILFAGYVEQWFTSRPKPLRPTTLDWYHAYLDKYILPTFGKMDVKAIEPEHVRAWYARMGKTATVSTRAKAYRLLHAILATAAEDETIPANPCKIKRGGIVAAAKRHAMDVSHVTGLADTIGPRYRAMVLIAGLLGLRHSELIGLQRRDINLTKRELHVDRIQVRLTGRWLVQDPKTEAGKRTLYLAPEVVEILREHLGKYVGSERTAWVFTTRTGAPVHRSNFDGMLKRRGAKLGASGVHPHLLRHSALTGVAQSGATTAELMRWGGHSTYSAAMTYQHAADNRMRELGDRILLRNPVTSSLYAGSSPTDPAPCQ